MTNHCINITFGPFMHVLKFCHLSGIILQSLYVAAHLWGVFLTVLLHLCVNVLYLFGGCLQLFVFQIHVVFFMSVDKCNK